MDEMYFCPEIYFGCNQYDDDVINFFLNTWWDKSYARSFARQRDISSSQVLSIHLSDFKLDSALNAKLKIPARSYTYKADNFYIPIADKKRFVRKYGNFNKPVAQKDIMRDLKVFSHSIDVTIDKYGYLDMYFYPTVYNYTYLVLIPVFTPTRAIPVDGNEIYETFETSVPTAAGNITDEFLAEMMEADYEMTVRWSKHGCVYHGYGAMNTLLNSSTNYTDLPKESLFANYGTSMTSYNSYDLYVSDASRSGIGLYAQTITTLKEVTEDGILHFVVPSGFRNHITQGGFQVNSSISVYVVQRPTRCSTLTYEHSETKVPIFQLKALKNPIDSVNYLISVYDAKNSIKGITHIFEDKSAYFPDILKLDDDEQFKDKDLLIEVYELPYRNTMSLFDNPVQNYMDALGDDYTKIVIDAEKCPEPISKYRSTLLSSSEGEYSWWKWMADHKDNPTLQNDFRAYRLTVLDKILTDNPLAYKYLQIYLDRKNKVYASKSGGPAYLKFSKETYMDSSDLALVVKDDTMTFKEPQGRISFHSKYKDSPSLVYVNGKLVSSTYECYCNDMQYVFLPASLTDEIKSKYNGEDDTAKPEDCYPMTVDAFPQHSNSAFINNSESNVFYSPEDPHKKLFENGEIGDFSINDLVVYNAATGEYVDPNELSFGLLVDEYEFKNEVVDTVVAAQKAAEVEYLLTMFQEIFRTMDKNEIVLKDSDVEVNMDDFIEKLPGGSDSMQNKKFQGGDVDFGIKNKGLAGQTLTVVPGKHMGRRKFTGAEVLQDSHTLEYKNYIHPCDSRRIEVYLNGLLLNEDEDYTIEFPKAFNGTMTIKFLKETTIATDATIEVIVLPMPMDTSTFTLRPSYNNFATNFVTKKWSSENSSFTGEDTGIDFYQADIKRTDSWSARIFNPEVCRVFVNGYRTYYEDRDNMKIVNGFYLDEALKEQLKHKDAPIDLTKDIKVTIRQPLRDVFPYAPNIYPQPMENQILQMKDLDTAVAEPEKG